MLCWQTLCRTCYCWFLCVRSLPAICSWLEHVDQRHLSVTNRESSTQVSDYRLFKWICARQLAQELTLQAGSTLGKELADPENDSECYRCRTIVDKYCRMLLPLKVLNNEVQRDANGRPLCGSCRTVHLYMRLLPKVCAWLDSAGLSRLSVTNQETQTIITKFQKRTNKRQQFPTIWETEETEETEASTHHDSTLSQGVQADTLKLSHDRDFDPSSFTHGRAGRCLSFLSIDDEGMLIAVSQKHWKLFQNESISQKTSRGAIRTSIDNRQTDSTYTRPSGRDSKIGPENPLFWSNPASSYKNTQVPPHIQTSDDFSAALRALFVV